MQMKLLMAKERRLEKQTLLLDEFGCTLVSFSLNIPGLVKDSQTFRAVRDIGIQDLVNHCPAGAVKHMERLDGDTGPEGYIVLDIEAESVKRIAVSIEIHHPLGRIFDIDVFDGDGQQIGRSEVNLPPRKCLVCSRDAHECTRNQTHGIENLIECIEQMCTDYFEQDSLTEKAVV